MFGGMVSRLSKYIQTSHKAILSAERKHVIPAKFTNNEFYADQSNGNALPDIAEGKRVYFQIPRQTIRDHKCFNQKPLTVITDAGGVSSGQASCSRMPHE